MASLPPSILLLGALVACGTEPQAPDPATAAQLTQVQLQLEAVQTELAMLKTQHEALADKQRQDQEAHSATITEVKALAEKAAQSAQTAAPSYSAPSTPSLPARLQSDVDGNTRDISKLGTRLASLEASVSSLASAAKSTPAPASKSVPKAGPLGASQDWVLAQGYALQSDLAALGVKVTANAEAIASMACTEDGSSEDMAGLFTFTCDSDGKSVLTQVGTPAIRR